MKLSSPKIKKFLIFSQKKLVLYFGKWNFLKKTSYILGGKTHSEKNSYISGNGIF